MGMQETRRKMKKRKTWKKCLLLFVMRRMPCIIGSEKWRNFIYSMRGKKMRGEGKNIMEAEMKAERGKVKRLSSRLEKGGIRRCV